MQYLLTRVSLNIPNGTVLMIPDKNMELQPWLVYWLESIKASGYNRYIVLKMTHYLTWTARDGQEYSSWAYMFGQENNMLKDELIGFNPTIIHNDLTRFFYQIKDCL